MSANQTKTGERVAVRERPETKTPPLYKVFLLNDDYTTMNFVVYILENVFHKPHVEATQIMLHVHKTGKGLAGVYAHEIAETKIEAARELSKKNGFPLKCALEKE